MFVVQNQKACSMSDSKLPLIHKAPVEGIQIHVARARLVIGDNAMIDRLPDGRIGVFASVSQPVFGIFPRRRMALIGHLGPSVEDILAPSLSHGDPLRVRIIDLTPEHLANGFPPEIYISVWGDPRHLTHVFGVPEAFQPLPEPEPRLPIRTGRIHPA
jgi:hypothetical protein